MCGRYALIFRPRDVQLMLADSNMPSQETPDDDSTRQTHNFPPGSYGLVYRVDVPDQGAGSQSEEAETGLTSSSKEKVYKLQAMKWGLVPFWTKRSPDYGSMLRTINCRDDSLATKGGLWQTMKQKKRCIVVAQGFFEWLKKEGSKEKIPHYVKRKDGQLMCFAGLWDCVQYEDSNEKLYTYTIITTSSNKQLGFLHDRMPVIFDNGSEDLFTWLDSDKSEWTSELQSLLQPYKDELDCYPVPREVGKVGNDSPSFIVPIDSSQNKQNIVNFFAKQKQAAETTTAKAVMSEEEEKSKKQDTTVKKEMEEDRETQMTTNDSDNNAPKPVTSGLKHPRDESDDNGTGESPAKATMPNKSGPPPSKKNRSATKNGTRSLAQARNGSLRIDGFFKPK